MIEEIDKINDQFAANRGPLIFAVNIAIAESLKTIRTIGEFVLWAKSSNRALRELRHLHRRIEMLEREIDQLKTVFDPEVTYLNRN